MRRLTASKFELALQCVAPWTVYADKWDDEGSPSSRYARKLGSAFHKYAEYRGDVDMAQLVKTYELTPALERRLRAMAGHWNVWLNTSKPEPLGVEVKYSIDPLLGVVSVLDAPGERDYSQAPPDHVTGTADLVLYGSRRVKDWKTSSYASHPTNNGQMRLLALMVARHQGWWSIGADIDVFEESGHTPQVSEQGPRELDRTEADLYSVAKLIRDGSDQTNPSPQACRFCPVRSVCPDRIAA